MPIYEYECAKCGKTIEIIQKMSDKPLKKHGGCGGGLTKLISASGFHFKGTGWYVTDYGRKGAAPESSETATDKKAESKESKDAERKRDSAQHQESKDTSSNGNKEGSSSKAGSEKAGKKDDSSKSGAKKD